MDFNKVSNYFNWLLENYHAVQKQVQEREAYKITNIKSINGKTLFYINIVGTSKDIMSLAEELVVDDVMLDKFSKKDIRIITYYASIDSLKPKMKIKSYRFCEKTKKTIFQIININDPEKIIEKNAQEISLDKSITSNFGNEDSRSFGYIQGTEDTYTEQEEKLKLKQKKV